MNKSYRIVWSAARNAYIVAGENAKAKGKPSSTRKGIVSAVAAALLAMGAGQAMAADQTLSASTTGPILSTGLITINSGVTVTAGAAISGLGGNAGIQVTAAATGGAITNNNGTIAAATGSAQTRGIAIQGTLNGGISNTGTISTSFIGIEVIGGALNANVSGQAIYNNGTIQSTGGFQYASAIAVDSLGTVTGDIVNDTLGTLHGNSSGVLLLNSTLDGSITNSGTISGSAAAGIKVISSTITGAITNNAGGTISGVVTFGLAAGINVTGGSTVGSITNSGTISGTSNGIKLSSASTITGAITNNTGGTISRGIDVAGGSTVGSITNSGTISGTNNGINLDSSTITGAITNNAGGNISGTSDGIYLGRSTVGSISNAGTISGSSTAAIWLWRSTITGSLSNSGSISGGSSGILVNNASTITGDITNEASGTISGSSSGIHVSRASSIGGITNSGTISGSAAAGIKVISSNTVTGAITNNAGGTISGSTAGIAISSAASTSSITNSGTISGNQYGISVWSVSSLGAVVNEVGGIISARSSSGSGILALNNSTISSITNSGTISGGYYGIAILSGSSIQGAITNSGTISGNTNAIFVDGTSTLSNIYIAGNDTASFVGEVNTPNTAVSVLTGATYTMNNGQLFTLNGTSSGFTVAGTGTLAVAAGGTATITGNYTQEAAATFRTNVTDDTTYGKLLVTGTATLPTNAKIDVNVANPNFAFTATGMAGIISAGTLTSDGTFAVTDNSALFDFTATKNGNAVDLSLAPVGAGGTSTAVVTAVTGTGNTAAAGAAVVLDSLATAFAGGSTGNADMDTVMAALGGLTTNQQLSDAASSTVPLMTGQAMATNLKGVNRVVQAQSEGNLGLSSGDAFVSDGKLWLKPLGSWADQKNANGAFGYNAQTYGMVLGADGDLSQHSRVGAAFAYTHSNVSDNSGTQSAGVDSYQAVLYGSNSISSDVEFNWQADYGYNQNKGNRYIAFVNRTAVANYNSDSLHLGTGIGHTLTISEKTRFTPSFRADYTSITDKGYTETGAGALNLTVNGKTTEEFILALDGKIVHSVNENAQFTTNLGLGYDVNAKQNSITSSFAGGGAAFTTTGIKPSATLARAGLGYVHNTDSGVEITARYDVEARTGFTAQTASVKLRMPF